MFNNHFILSVRHSHSPWSHVTGIRFNMTVLIIEKLNLMPTPSPTNRLITSFCRQDSSEGLDFVFKIQWMYWLDRESEHGSNSDVCPSPLHAEFNQTFKKKKKISKWWMCNLVTFFILALHCNFLLYMLVQTRGGGVTDFLIWTCISKRSRVEMTLFTLVSTCSSKLKAEIAAPPLPKKTPTCI